MSKKTDEELEEFLEKVDEDLKKIMSEGLFKITSNFELYEKLLYDIIKEALKGDISIEDAFDRLELCECTFKEALKRDINRVLKKYKKAVKAYLQLSPPSTSK